MQKIAACNFDISDDINYPSKWNWFYQRNHQRPRQGMKFKAGKFKLQKNIPQCNLLGMRQGSLLQTSGGLRHSSSYLYSIWLSWCLPTDRAGISWCFESKSFNVNNWSCAFCNGHPYHQKQVMESLNFLRGNSCWLLADHWWWSNTSKSENKFLDILFSRKIFQVASWNAGGITINVAK